MSVAFFGDGYMHTKNKFHVSVFTVAFLLVCFVGWVVIERSHSTTILAFEKLTPRAQALLKNSLPHFGSQARVKVSQKGLLQTECLQAEVPFAYHVVSQENTPDRCNVVLKLLEDHAFLVLSLQKFPQPLIENNHVAMRLKSPEYYTQMPVHTPEGVTEALGFESEDGQTYFMKYGSELRIVSFSQVTQIVTLDAAKTRMVLTSLHTL